MNGAGTRLAEGQVTRLELEAECLPRRGTGGSGLRDPQLAL